MYLCAFWRVLWWWMACQPLPISFTSLTLVLTYPNWNSRCQEQACQTQHPKSNEKPKCPTFRTPPDIRCVNTNERRVLQWRVNVAFHSSRRRKTMPCQTFYVSVGRVMTLFATRWPLDALSTSECYTASPNIEGKQRLGKRPFSTMKRRSVWGGTYLYVYRCVKQKMQTFCHCLKSFKLNKNNFTLQKRRIE